MFGTWGLIAALSAGIWSITEDDHDDWEDGSKAGGVLGARNRTEGRKNRQERIVNRDGLPTSGNVRNASRFTPSEGSRIKAFALV
jgi:hypothetical protein